LRRYALPDAPRILDAGCGTGEASRRLAEAFPRATVLGVDILDSSLERARGAAAHLGDRVRFEHRSIFDLGLPGGSFDLVVNRHVLQSIPHAERAIAELVRATRPGGWIHLIAEDYGMIHFPRRRFGEHELWPTIPHRFGEATGTDMLIGRRAPAILAGLGVSSMTVDHVVIDPLRVPRETFARIWEAWRDGYSAAIAEHCGVTEEWAVERFEDQLETIRDPGSYAAWIVPVVAGRVGPQPTR
ncbi:MAG TPA: class I SAM-dependent methyltransferase, partial [Anaeromyxobacteraceae bacterium]|nr:class I SAM-dependent methyltransferase [Anaeromyxobacteraceae bacterium]